MTTKRLPLGKPSPYASAKNSNRKVVGNWGWFGPVGPSYMVPASGRVIQFVFLLWGTIGAVFMEGKFAQWDPHFTLDGTPVATHSVWSVFWAFMVCVMPAVFQIFFTEFTERSLDVHKRNRFEAVTWGLILAWGARNAVVHHNQNVAQQAGAVQQAAQASSAAPFVPGQPWYTPPAAAPRTLPPGAAQMGSQASGNLNGYGLG